MGLTLIVGGARSGKSTLAVRLAEGTDRPAVFIATAEARDGEMADRIARHRTERPEAWTTIEEPVELGSAIDGADDGAALVVDCLSLWVSNLMEREVPTDDIAERARRAAAGAAGRAAPTIAVSNEVGMGVVPTNALARRYRDALGAVNAIWSEAADEAFLVVAGRTLALDRRA